MRSCSRRARPTSRRAPASMTKLMTVLVALEHARLDDVVTVSPLAAAGRRVERQPARGRAADGARPRDRGARPERERCGHGTRRVRRPWLDPAVRRADERRRHDAARAHLDALRNPHGLDQPGHVSSARDMTTLLDGGAPQSVHPHVVDPLDGDDRRRPHADLDRRPDRHAAADRRQDGPHQRRRLVAGRGRRSGDGVRITASVLGSPSEAQRNADLGGLLAWGLAQYHRVKAIDVAASTVCAETGYGRSPSGSSPRDDVVRDGARGEAARRARRRRARLSRFPSSGASESAR